MMIQSSHSTLNSKPYIVKNKNNHAVKVDLLNSRLYYIHFIEKVTSTVPVD